MRVEIDLKKSVQRNISHYFDASKKSKAKLSRVSQAIVDMKQRIARAEQKSEARAQQPSLERKRAKHWYEKFHWMHTSDRLLCIAGRDAHSNEQIVKRHMDESDQYFHADVQGAAHTVLKSNGKPISEQSKREAAQFAAIWSKAWQQKLASVDVYSAKPGQVSKKAPSGESMGTGAFMVYGKREWFKKTPLRCAVGVGMVPPNGWKVVSGPKTALPKTLARWVVELVPGGKTKSALAKELQYRLKKAVPSARVPLDEWISMLPNGESDIAREKIE